MAVFTSYLKGLEAFDRKQCIGTCGREIFFAADKLGGDNGGRGAISVMKRNVYSAQPLKTLVDLPFRFTQVCSLEPKFSNASIAIYELHGNYIYAFACGSFNDDDEFTINVIRIGTKSGGWTRYCSAIPLSQRLQIDQNFEFSVVDKDTTLRFICGDDAFVELALLKKVNGLIKRLKFELDLTSSELIVAEKWCSFEDEVFYSSVEPVGKNWFALNGTVIYKFQDVSALSPTVYRAQKAVKRTLKKLGLWHICRGIDANSLSLVAELCVPYRYSRKMVDATQSLSRFFVFDVKFDDLRRTFGFRLSAKSIKISLNLIALFNANRHFSDLRVCRCDGGQLVLQRCHGNTSLIVFVGQMSLFRAAFLAFQKAISAAEVGEFEEVSGGVEDWVDSAGLVLDFK